MSSEEENLDSSQKSDLNPDFLVEGLLNLVSDVEISGESIPEFDDENVIERKTKKEGLVFSPGVEFLRIPAEQSFEEIDYSTLQDLPSVDKNSEFASQGESAHPIIKAGRNVECELKDEMRIFTAIKTGKVVLHHGGLSIVPEDADARISLLIKGREKVYADLYPSRGKGAPLSLDLLKKRLKKEGVVYGIREYYVEGMMRRIEEAKVLKKKIVVAESDTPKHGRDARVEFKIDVERTKHQSFKILEDGRVDYKDKGAIPEVKKGEVLAILHPASVGIDGTDIFGKKISATDGADSSICAGEGVIFVEEKNEFISTQEGEVIFLDQKTIEVKELHVIPGDVDYATGNISFSGNLLIQGSVRSGFSVQSKGIVTILGEVGNSSIKSGLDLFIGGGVRGQKNSSAKIECGRDLDVRFVQNATLEALGNIHIMDFSVQSNLQAGGEISILKGKGSLIGGKTLCMKGFEAKSIGSPLGVKTQIETGNDYLVGVQLQKKRAQHKLFQQALQKIETNLILLSKLTEEQKKALENRKSDLKKVLAKKEALKAELQFLENQINFLETVRADSELPYLRVSGIIHTDCSLKIRDKWFLVQKEMTAVQFYYDRKEEEIRFSRWIQGR